MFSARNLFKTNTLINFNVFKLTVLLLTGSLTANAQNSFFHPFSIGDGYGVTVANAGEQTLTSSNATNINLNYNFTPFASLGIELQVGQLTGGNAQMDTFGKQFVNDYNSIVLHTDLQLGELIDYSQSVFLNGLKNLYAGVGVGIIKNKISKISLLNPADSLTPLTFTPSSTNFLVPLRVGYEFKIYNKYDEPQFRFDINYSFNTAFGKGLDGYTSIYSKAAGVKFYNYFSVGFKYGFGSVKPYRKQVYYQYF
jgi:hypothetical protein